MRTVLVAFGLLPVIAVAIFATTSIRQSREDREIVRSIQPDLRALGDAVIAIPTLATVHNYWIGIAALEDIAIDPYEYLRSNAPDPQEIDDARRRQDDQLSTIVETLERESARNGNDTVLSGFVTRLAEFRSTSRLRTPTMREVDQTFTGADEIVARVVRERISGVRDDSLQGGALDDTVAAYLDTLSDLQALATANGRELWTSTRILSLRGLDVFTGTQSNIDYLVDLRATAIADVDSRIASLKSGALPTRRGFDVREVVEFEGTNGRLKFRTHIDRVLTEDDYVRDIGVEGDDNTGIFFAQLDTLERAASASSDSIDELSRELTDQLDHAERELGRTIAIAGALGIAILLAAGAAGAFLARPARRVAARARALSAGEVELTPLPRRGPSELVDIADALNQATAELSTISRGALALADGSLDETTDLLSSSSLLAASVQRSFERIRELNSRASASEARATAIIEHAAEAIFVLDAAGVILETNLAADRLLDVTDDELAGQLLADHVLDLPPGELGSWDDAEVSFVTSMCATVPAIASSSQFNDGERLLTVLVARDITERKELESRLQELALRDALTGLPNRRALFEHVSAVIEAARDEGGVVALLYLDLDGFKAVNDTAGHFVGDRVLRVVAERLQAAAGRRAMVGRLGGDEFLIVLAGTHDSVDELETARVLLDAVEEPVRDGSQTFSISAGIGTTRWSAAVIDAAELLVNADLAVYRAKESGPGSIVTYTEDLRRRAAERADIEMSFPTALASGELKLHLQPIVNQATQQVVSAEGLIRWDRPGLGLWFPGQFLPIVEMSDLIVDLGVEVMNQACDLVALWQRERRDRLTLSINLSGRHLTAGDPVADLEAALMRSGADPSWLQIEITESHLLADLDSAIEILHQLRSLGVKIALDDFGTGYSSLTYLRRLPVDTVKIDRSFVMDMLERTEDQSIVEMIVALAGVLELDVVAEGVETIEQAARLTELGCAIQQGYVHAKPMPVETFENWLPARTSNVA
jgi:diguanylate cyclase (GGDEF)-like protein